jgi:alpha-L-rhamnosidase
MIDLRDARWITTPLQGTGRVSPPVPVLRGKLELPAKPTSARLTITAWGVYGAQINGRRVGRDELQPGWHDYRKRLYAQQYDVADLLQAGRNALAVWLGDGWAVGHVANLDRGVLYAQRPRLWARLEVQGADGSNQTLITDDHWRWQESPIRAADLFDGEHHDARRSIDDAAWQPVEVLEDLAGPAEASLSPAPPIRVTQQLPAVAEPITVDYWNNRKAFVFDFGQNFTGKVQLQLRGAAGLTLMLRHAEVLKPDGKRPDTSNLRTCRATDSYTLRGDPAGETWSPRFTFHGFRYAELSYDGNFHTPGGDAPLDPPARDSAVGLVMHSDMRRIGTFQTGHPLLNRLHQNIVWGLRSNVLDVPTDCPQRDERLGWTGDAQVITATAGFLYDTSGFFEKWIGDLADAQDEHGRVPSFAPTFRDPVDSGAGWSDAAVIVPWQTYRCTGRRELLEQAYPMMRRWAEYQAATADDGVRGRSTGKGHVGYGDWLALDGKTDAAGDTATPKDLIGTAYHAYSQRLFARIAALLGHDADRDAANAAADLAVAAFGRCFVQDGRLTVASQTSHLLALGFDLLDEADRPGVLEALLVLLRESDGHLQTGFLGTPMWGPVLTRFGRTDVMVDLLLQEGYPGWLYPVTLGATTMWERWNSWHPEQGFVDTSMNSLNHYAYGAVGDWMHRTLGGIDLDLSEDRGGPGLVMRPHADHRLGHCDCGLDSAVGRIESSWRVEGDWVRYRMLVPEGVPAVRVTPGGDRQPLTAGAHEFDEALEGGGA